MHFKPTVLADAHHLPFKDGSFELVKASHLLEHLRNPQKALDEMLRVATKEVVLKFPTELDVLPWFVSNIFPPSFSGLRGAYQTRKKRLHLWVIKPEAIISYLKNKGWECSCGKNTFSFFHFLEKGRKAKYFQLLIKQFRIPLEYVIIARKVETDLRML
jgi:ubiquinone/menaquinone biosynthesis C-methylase UbiE